LRHTILRLASSKTHSSSQIPSSLSEKKTETKGTLSVLKQA